ncbi:hypothetical protein [Nostoc sp.]|uniref:hypothetical protein n=1 Tax=Nostoc sp. TaxID=1180 RepID=UPI002FF92B53
MADDKIFVPDYTWTVAKPGSNISSGATVQTFTPSVNAATPLEDSLPDNFDPFEHLQQVYIPQHNAAVRLYFSDLPNDWKPNIATARSSLRTACTMLDGDNQLMMNLRHHLLFDLLGYGKSDLIVYNGSRNDILPPVDGHPIVKFYFSQDIESVPHGQNRTDAEYSFRLMNETATTFTKANAMTLATKVKQHMIVSNQGIMFTKGKNIYLYRDEMHGYRLKLYGNQEADAIDLITRMLECQDLAFDENKLTVSTPKKSNTVTPATVEVYGKEVKKNRYRPIDNVRFRYAYVEVPLLKKPIYLVDTTYRHTPLVH